MINVVLRGAMAKRFRGNQPDGSWLLDVQTPREAMMAIEANIGGIVHYLIGATKRGIEYRVVIDGQDIEHIDQVHIPMGDYDTIEIIPIVVGEANPAWWQIIAGIALIVVGIVVGFGTFASAGLISGVLIKFGIGLILSGITSLVFAPGKADTGSSGKNKASYLFNGQVNQTRQGEAVPLCYGRLIVGSQIVSAYLTTLELDRNGHVISHIPTDSNPPSTDTSTGPLAAGGGLAGSGRAPNTHSSTDTGYSQPPTIISPGTKEV